MAFRSALFTVESTQLDVQQLLVHVNEQYLDYLGKKGSLMEGVAPTFLHGVDTEEQQYPGYKINFIDAELMHHLCTFLESKHVDVNKVEHADENRCSLIINKESLARAALTNRDQGEYLFRLNKHLQGLLNPVSNEKKGMQP